VRTTSEVFAWWLAPSWPRPVRVGLEVLHRGRSGHVGGHVAWLLNGVTVLTALTWL
jgi:hypothetical protein